LLTRNGYHRVMQEISLFDDWYVKDWAATKLIDELWRRQ
jgi:hypothetical protein